MPARPAEPPPDTDPHKPLRQDVRFLGELLGETLRSRLGEPFFDTVEQVRTTAKAAHGETGGFSALAGMRRRLPVDSAIPLGRAVTRRRNLGNVAARPHR